MTHFNRSDCRRFCARVSGTFTALLALFSAGELRTTAETDKIISRALTMGWELGQPRLSWNNISGTAFRVEFCTDLGQEAWVVRVTLTGMRQR